MGIFKSNPWTLHNPLKSWTLQGLSDEEAQIVVSILTLAESNVVLVWNKDWSHWLPLRSPECRLLFVPWVPLGPNPPEMTAEVGLHDPVEDETTQVRPVHVIRKTMIDRRHERYLVRISCDVVVGENVFSTHSKDISTGGICFEEALPEWVAGYFTVIIKSENPLEIVCMMVEDQKKDKFRAEILESNPERLSLLRNWLKESGFPLLST